MTELKGQALKDRAQALDIPGRSKLTARELREAIAEVEETQAILADPATMEAIQDGEVELDVEQRLTEAAQTTDDYLTENDQGFIQRVMSRLNLDTFGLISRSGQGTPMSQGSREDNYRRQNNGGKVRAGKQARRSKHKQNKVNG